MAEKTKTTPERLKINHEDDFDLISFQATVSGGEDK